MLPVVLMYHSKTFANAVHLHVYAQASYRGETAQHHNCLIGKIFCCSSTKTILVIILQKGQSTHLADWGQDDRRYDAPNRCESTDMRVGDWAKHHKNQTASVRGSGEDSVAIIGLLECFGCQSPSEHRALLSHSGYYIQLHPENDTCCFSAASKKEQWEWEQVLGFSCLFNVWN